MKHAGAAPSWVLMQGSTPEMPGWLAFLFIAAVLLVVVTMLAFVAMRYRRCPPNKILVIYGKVEGGKACKCLSSGGAFVWPLIQDYAYLDCNPIRIQHSFDDQMTQDGEPVGFDIEMTIQISRDPERMELAAERLLSLSEEQITDMALHGAHEQFAKVVGGVSSESLQNNRHAVSSKLNEALSREYGTIGLELTRMTLSNYRSQQAGGTGLSGVVG